MKLIDLIQIKYGHVFLAGCTLGDNRGFVSECLLNRGMEVDDVSNGYIFSEIVRQGQEDYSNRCYQIDGEIEDEYFDGAILRFSFEEISEDWLYRYSLSAGFSDVPYNTFADFERLEDKYLRDKPFIAGDEWPCLDYFSVEFVRSKKEYELHVNVDQKYGSITSEHEQQLWHALTNLIREAI